MLFHILDNREPRDTIIMLYIRAYAVAQVKVGEVDDLNLKGSEHDHYD